MAGEVAVLPSQFLRVIYWVEDKKVLTEPMVEWSLRGEAVKMYGFQMGPVVLGIILGPLMEDNYRRAMMDVHNSIPGFFWEMIRHPLSLMLLLANIFSVGTQTKTWTRILAKFKKLW